MGGAGASGFDFSGFDFSDIFGDLFGSAFGGFGGFGGRTSNSNSRARRGSDNLMRVDLTFEEAIFGCKKKINFTKSLLIKSLSGAMLKTRKKEVYT